MTHFRANLVLGSLLVMVSACDYYASPRYSSRYAYSEQAPPENAQAPTNDPAYASEEVAIGTDSEDTTEYVDTDASALTEFHEPLDPYGAWSDDPTYGTVWTPAPTVVGPDFAPYVSGGHWVYDDDYAWVSDYDWGWAPFHYGRWVYITGRGWSWIPGRRYAGAWVVWRTGDPGYGYVGWAPAPPVWGWHHGVAVGIGFVPVASYTFVSTGDVFAPAVSGHVVRGAQVSAIAAKTRPFVAASPGIVPLDSSGHERSTAHPVVGPPPAQLGLDAHKIVKPSGQEPGLARATQISHPTPRNINGDPNRSHFQSPTAPVSKGPSVDHDGPPQQRYAPPHSAPPQMSPQPQNVNPPQAPQQHVAPPQQHVTPPSQQQHAPAPSRTESVRH